MSFSGLSNLNQRIIIGLPGAILFVLCVLFSPSTYFLLFFFLAVLAQREFYTMMGAGGYLTSSRLWTVVGAAINVTLFAVFSGLVPANVAHVCVLFLFIPFMAGLYKKGANLLPETAYGLLGIVYVALPFALFHGIAFTGTGMYNAYMVLSFMLLLWASDTGAYIFGKLMGRTKLFPSVSPGKTWEGSIGGLITALLMAWGLHAWLEPAPLNTMLGMAVVIVVFGGYGDLVESKIKRILQIKDSSDFLPGHGGLLDRFDGLLLAAPAVYVFLKISLLNFTF